MRYAIKQDEKLTTSVIGTFTLGKILATDNPTQIPTTKKNVNNVIMLCLQNENSTTGLCSPSPIRLKIVCCCQS